MTHTKALQAYGLFMVAWSVLEAVLEVAIMKQLKLQPKQAAVVTAGLAFKARSSILSGLLALDGPQHIAAIKLLERITKDAKRNALVHGHIFVGEAEKLTFVKADVSSSYRAKRVAFTADELLRHVSDLNQNVEELQRLLQVSDAELQEFARIGHDASGEKKA